MGWWNAGEDGSSLHAENTGLLWGDGPADIVGSAIDKIVDEFRDAWDRWPTKQELEAGFNFVLGGYGGELGREPQPGSLEEARRVLAEATHPSVRVDVPDELWVANDGMDNPSDRLRVTLLVNGRYPMHFEAWAVTYDEDQMIQHLADGDDEDLDHLNAAVAADGSFYTTNIRGRDYILLASPFCN